MSGCRLSLQDTATAINAVLVGAEKIFEGVSTDSRSLQAGQLFVALKGPNYDGHNFAAQAVQSGAAGLLVEQQLELTAPQLIVKDSLKALGQLASYWRQQLGLPIVAVTGSNGKTTVKEMIASILAQSGEIFATRGNLNNDIGVPITLLSIGRNCRAAIVEMGANHAGEIAYLTNLTQPNVAIITNAAAAHLEGFGSLGGVAKAKGEIFQGLGGCGAAIINADDKYCKLWTELADANQVLTFGLRNQADISCEWQWGGTGSELNITTPQGALKCRLQLIGQHNVMNALAATAAALAAGASLPDIKNGLEGMRAVPGRLQLKKGVNQSTLIDDTYNANPNSLLAAMEVLASFQGKKYLALGDMGELGDDAGELHRQAGEAAKKLGVDALFGIGEYSKMAVRAFGDAGRHFTNHETMSNGLRTLLDKNTTLLVKGSRSMRMERIVDDLQLNKQSDVE